MQNIIDSLKTRQNKEMVEYSELEALAGVSIHPGAVPLSSGAWLKYLSERKKLKDQVNKAATDAGLPKRDYFQLVPCTDVIYDDDGEEAGREYKMQLLKGKSLSEWHVENGHKRIKGASANLKRRLIRVKDKAYLPPQEKHRLNAVLAVVEIHEKLCLKTADKYASNAFGRHKSLPEASLRMLVDNATDEAFEEVS